MSHQMVKEMIAHADRAANLVASSRWMKALRWFSGSWECKIPAIGFGAGFVLAALHAFPDVSQLISQGVDRWVFSLFGYFFITPFVGLALFGVGHLICLIMATFEWLKIGETVYSGPDIVQLASVEDKTQALKNFNRTQGKEWDELAPALYACATRHDLSIAWWKEVNDQILNVVPEEPPSVVEVVEKTLEEELENRMHVTPTPKKMIL